VGGGYTVFQPPTIPETLEGDSGKGDIIGEVVRGERISLVFSRRVRGGKKHGQGGGRRATRRVTGSLIGNPLRRSGISRGRQ